MTIRAIVQATLLALAIAGPAAAQSAPGSPGALTGVGSPLGGRQASQRVERYITDLHDRLGVRPNQQAQWDAFATVMRENAAKQEAAYKEREARTTPVSAVDDLRNYAAMERRRAADVDRLVAPFDALYQSMDAVQRAGADRTFGDIQRSRVGSRG